MMTYTLLDRLLAPLDCCPWGAAVGTGHHAPRRVGAVRRTGSARVAAAASPRPLYTAEERRRRDATRWTTVQAVLAPLQFLVFLVSLVLVLRALATGEGLALATASVVAKTLVLYTIMLTGMAWERRVFGRWLFAPAFFWEDALGIVVLALHTAYIAVLAAGYGDAQWQLSLALAAYATYVANAAQFVVKLRSARLEGCTLAGGTGGAAGAAG